MRRAGGNAFSLPLDEAEGGLGGEGQRLCGVNIQTVLFSGEQYLTALLADKRRAGLRSYSAWHSRGFGPLSRGAAAAGEIWPFCGIQSGNQNWTPLPQLLETRTLNAPVHKASSPTAGLFFPTVSLPTSTFHPRRRHKLEDLEEPRLSISRKPFLSSTDN